MTNTTPPPVPDALAEAIAKVTEMRETILAQQRSIKELQHSLQTQTDRVYYLLEERARFRADAMACRTFVTKLATIQESIHKLSNEGSRILDDMAAMDAEHTKSEDIKEEAAALQTNLEKLRNIENGKTSFPPVPEGARTDTD